MRLFTAAALFLCVCFPAEASHRHMHSGHRHHFAHHWGHGSSSHARMAHRRGRGKGARLAYRQRSPRVLRGRGGLVTVLTAAGPITVASHLAGRFQALIADLVPLVISRVTSVASRQRDMSRTHGTMWAPHVISISTDGARRFPSCTVPMQLSRAMDSRDGCSFADCGHVDDGQFVHYAHRWRGSSFGG